jgi:hypothetical protein
MSITGKYRPRRNDWNHRVNICDSSITEEAAGLDTVVVAEKIITENGNKTKKRRSSIAVPFRRQTFSNLQKV